MFWCYFKQNYSFARSRIAQNEQSLFERDTSEISSCSKSIFGKIFSIRFSKSIVRNQDEKIRMKIGSHLVGDSGLAKVNKVHDFSVLECDNQCKFATQNAIDSK